MPSGLVPRAGHPSGHLHLSGVPGTHTDLGSACNTNETSQAYLGQDSGLCPDGAPCSGSYCP